MPQRLLWADLEVFAWEGPPNEQNSPLIPAPWTRVQQQLEAVAPFVDEVLIYQFQGLVSRPGSRAFAGHRDSTRLYADYVRWLKTTHRDLVTVTASPTLQGPEMNNGQRTSQL